MKPLQNCQPVLQKIYYYRKTKQHLRAYLLPCCCGKLDAKTVLAAIKKGGGKAVLTTVAGGKLTAEVVDGNFNGRKWWNVNGNSK